MTNEVIAAETTLKAEPDGGRATVRSRSAAA
jgi:hypothetical protein